MNFKEGRVEIRDYIDLDYDSICNLNIKYDDALELERMTSMNFKEYIIWHLSELKEATKVVLYDGDIKGIMGIDKSSSTLWFTTIELTVAQKINLVRLFNLSLDTLMLEENKKEVFAYIDAKYESAIKWVLSKGFKKVEEVMLNNNKFYIIKYKLP